MVQVINGEVVQIELPQSGYLKNGNSVSGYNLLDAEILTDEGWLPLEDNPVESKVLSGYEVLEDKVIAIYS